MPCRIGAGYGPQPGDPVFTTPSPSFKVTSSIRSGQSSPRNISSPVQVLHGSASNSSLRSHSVRPSASIPSMRSGGESTHSHSGNRQWSRTHCPSPSVPPGSSPWTTTSSPGAASTSSSQPPSVMVKTKPGSPSPVYEPIRSTSDTWAPSGLRTSTSMGGIAQVPAPRLQRKKSSASLLVSGIGRGLGRVGSVMRRSSNNNNSSDASSQGSGSNGSGSGVGAQTAYNSQTWGAGRRPRRHASTQLQDLCEDENEARSGVSAAPLVKSKSVPIPNGPVDATGRKSRDMMPPGWTRVTAPSTVTPPHSAKNETSSGVSRPFNVQVRKASCSLLTSSTSCMSQPTSRACRRTGSTSSRRKAFPRRTCCLSPPRRDGSVRLLTFRSSPSPSRSLPRPRPTFHGLHHSRSYPQ